LSSLAIASFACKLDHHGIKKIGSALGAIRAPAGCVARKGTSMLVPQTGTQCAIAAAIGLSGISKILTKSKGKFEGPNQD